ncbi:unnamed protein product [Orchesella dallaii]|uniref:Formamidase n=1 Tax=Orchesella dallaii TaxID=48710 RepID=A0ABP1RPW7_9HEXA
MQRSTRTLISVDLTRSARSQPVLHNRWHPDLLPVASVHPGEVFRVECVDWTGGQIANNDSAEDVLNVDLTQVHYLSGPIQVEGAEPGDYLEVEILEIQPLQGHEWGYTGIFDVKNGGSFLFDYFPRAAKVIWDFEGIYASSRHIPGVRFAGLIHPGILGTAPSQELLNKWNHREADLLATDPDRVPPLAYLPDHKGSFLGALENNPGVARRIAVEAARSVPPREHGGNCDIKNLSRGSKVWLPVYVPGAKLSVGDLHFSQGDGEISFCGGIEMAGAITLKTKLIKGGMALHGNLRNPIFMPGPVEPRFSKYISFQGISVDEHGVQHHLDATLSYKQAVLNCIDYFKRFGYTGEQIYLLLSSCPCEGRVNAIVDVPNACCSISIPTEIFDFDVTPKNGGHLVKITTNCPVQALPAKL